jgi:hypothetical protein
MTVKKRLDATVNRNPLAEQILKRRDGKSAAVSLARLEAELADANRYDIVASLKELEKAGWGRFIAGRSGQKSSFAWAERAPSEKKLTVGKASGGAQASAAVPAFSDEAAPQGSSRKALAPTSKRLERPKLSTRQPKTREPSDAPSARRLPAKPAARPLGRDQKLLQHSFHLRPGVLVTLELPEDVTPIEVDRFCHFLKAIPFAGSPRD